MAVSGICSEVPKENSGKIAGKLQETISQIAKCFKFWDIGLRERQTCREPWVDITQDLVPTLRAGCFFEIDIYNLLK